MIRHTAPGFILIALAACGHDQPFTQDEFGSDTTLTQGADRQLTYNVRTDRTPTWHPDGSAVYYMFEDGGSFGSDRCLGVLPGTGGSIRRVICPVTLSSVDSLDALYEPAINSSGRWLYVREASPFGSITPSVSALVLGDNADPLAATVVRSFPYTAVNGKIHQGISHVRWVNEDIAIYLAQRVMYLAECGTCPLDTVRSGLDLVTVDLSSPTPVLQIVPNTDEASSVSIGPGNGVYFTRNGDSRVYQLDRTSGATSIVHDFGAGQIARDVDVSGNRLFAIVGGRVSYVVDSVLGPLQRDEGGQMRMVDLSNGSETPLIVPGRFFRRPAASPSGGRMVAEAFPVSIVGCGGVCQDTSLAKVADLWLFDIP
jgi:hypothetical protein